MVDSRTSVFVSLLLVAALSVSISGAAAAATGVVITPAEDATAEEVTEQVNTQVGDAGGVTDVVTIGGQPYIYASIVNTAAIRELSSVSAVELRRRASVPTAPDVDTGRNFVGDTEYPWGIERVEAIKAADSVSGTADIDVAVVDTGVDLDHPELQSSIVWGANTTKDSNPTGNETADDDNGHGTHVAGIVTATDQNLGTLVGVSPAVDIYAMKAFDRNGIGDNKQVAQAINLAVRGPDNTTGTPDDAEIITISAGARQGNAVLKAAVNDATENGAVVVAAAGNRGDGNPDTNEIDFPAKYPNTISVGAVSGDSTTATFSAEGRQVDVGAPGDYILSTQNGGGTERRSGTSMAAPHVAGTLALVEADAGNISKQAALEFLTESAVDIDRDGVDKFSGAGSVRALAAVQRDEVPSSPDISVTKPEDGSEVVNTTSVEFRASDPQTDITAGNTALAVFRDDTKVRDLSVTEPKDGIFEASLDTTSLSEDADHTIRATATDDDGLTQSDERTVTVNNSRRGIFVSDVSFPAFVTRAESTIASVSVTNNAGFEQTLELTAYSPASSQYKRMTFELEAGATQTQTLSLSFESTGDKQLVVDPQSETLQTQTQPVTVVEPGNIPAILERQDELDITASNLTGKDNTLPTGESFNIRTNITNTGDEPGFPEVALSSGAPTPFETAIFERLPSGQTLEINATHPGISAVGTHEVSLESEQVANATTTVTVVPELGPARYDLQLDLPEKTILNNTEYTLNATVENVGGQTQSTTVVLNDTVGETVANATLSPGEKTQISLATTPEVSSDGTVLDVTAEAYKQDDYNGQDTTKDKVVNDTTSQIEVSAPDIITTGVTGRDKWNNTTLYDLTTIVENNGGKDGEFGGQLFVNGTGEKNIAPREIPAGQTRRILTPINISQTTNPAGDSHKNLTVIPSGESSQVTKIVDFSSSVPTDAQQIVLEDVVTRFPGTGENITSYDLNNLLSTNNTTTVDIETNTTASLRESVDVRGGEPNDIETIEPNLSISDGGDFSYTIRSEDFINTTRVVTVTDPREPDVQLNNSTVTNNPQVGQPINISVGVDNNGPVGGVAEGRLILTESVGTTNIVDEVPIDPPLPPESSVTINETLRTDTVGEYRVTLEILIDGVRFFNVVQEQTVTVSGVFDRIPPGVNGTDIPRDPDGDNLYEDITGDGEVTSADMVSLISVNAAELSPSEKKLLDFAGDGTEFNATKEALAFRTAFGIEKRLPRDPDNDGDYENIDTVEGTSSGEGRWLFDRLQEDTTNTWLDVYPEFIDFDEDGDVDIDDVRALHVEVLF